MRILNLVFACGLLAALNAEPVNAEDRALVIGINSYPGITIAGLPGQRDLKGAVLDANSMAEFLVAEYGFTKGQVKLLKDGDATRAAIIEAIKTWLIGGTQPGDRAVLYFAGHGAQARDENGDEPDGDRFDEALVPADAVGDLARAPVKLKNLILDDELGAYVEKLGDRDLIAIFDACHSGTITRSLDGAVPIDANFSPRTLTPRSPAFATRSFMELSDETKRLHKVNTRMIEVEAKTSSARKGSFAVWTATASSQLAFDSPNGGLFTQSFLTGLKSKEADQSGDGRIKAAELLTFVQELSEEICAARPEHCRHGLTPTLLATDGYLSEVVFPLEKEAETAIAAQKDQTAKPATAEPAHEDAAEEAKAQFTHKNDFDLQVEVLPKRKAKLGSEIRFRVTASEPGRLLLLDRGPDGNFIQIFPNQFAASYGKDGRIRANAPLTLPDATYGFAFEATDAGPSQLIALVVEESADVGDILGKHLDMETLKEPKKLISALAEKLRRPLETPLDDEPNRRIRWSYATVDYEVE